MATTMIKHSPEPLKKINMSLNERKAAIETLRAFLRGKVGSAGVETKSCQYLT